MIMLPVNIITRWQEAARRGDYRTWHALSELCMRLWAQATYDQRDATYIEDIWLLSELATIRAEMTLHIPMPAPGPAAITEFDAWFDSQDWETIPQANDSIVRILMETAFLQGGINELRKQSAFLNKTLDKGGYEP
jgi:hypothetical protein